MRRAYANIDWAAPLGDAMINTTNIREKLVEAIDDLIQAADYGAPIAERLQTAYNLSVAYDDWGNRDDRYPIGGQRSSASVLFNCLCELSDCRDARAVLVRENNALKGGHYVSGLSIVSAILDYGVSDREAHGETLPISSCEVKPMCALFAQEGQGSIDDIAGFYDPDFTEDMARGCLKSLERKGFVTSSEDNGETIWTLTAWPKGPASEWPSTTLGYGYDFFLTKGGLE